MHLAVEGTQNALRQIKGISPPAHAKIGRDGPLGPMVTSESFWAREVVGRRTGLGPLNKGVNLSFFSLKSLGQNLAVELIKVEMPKLLKDMIFQDVLCLGLPPELN